jgi:hypothetical protein
MPSFCVSDLVSAYAIVIEGNLWSARPFRSSVAGTFLYPLPSMGFGTNTEKNEGGLQVLMPESSGGATCAMCL